MEECSLTILLLNSRVCQWNDSENWLIFVEDMDNYKVGRFLRHNVLSITTAVQHPNIKNKHQFNRWHIYYIKFSVSKKYLKNSLKAERETMPESKLSTGGSCNESPAFRRPLHSFHINKALSITTFFLHAEQHATVLVVAYQTFTTCT